VIARQAMGLKEMPDTEVNSFVIRFVQESPFQNNIYGHRPWRGTIRHVQSSQEQRFTQIKDALEFMQEFLDLNQDNLPSEGLAVNE
jgi:hypothetical protein